MDKRRSRPVYVVAKRISSVRMHRCPAPRCTTMFEPYRADHVYCSPACRTAAWRARERQKRNAGNESLPIVTPTSD